MDWFTIFGVGVPLVVGAAILIGIWFANRMNRGE